jgi:hypothetical protein
LKISVVTPYYREPIDVLRKCHASVRDQTVPAVHYLIADGFPQTWIDGESPRHTVHLKLPKAHGDCGNTPRGLGALLAFADGAQAICFLDADNTFDADHVEHCLDTYRSHPQADFIAALRRIVLPDGTLVPGPDEPTSRHIDTSCFFLLPGSLHSVSQFVMQPKEMSPFCDRLFYAYLLKQRLNMAVCAKPTVTFVSTYANHYKRAGLPPPRDAKPPQPAQFTSGIANISREQWALWRMRMGGIERLPE